MSPATTSRVHAIVDELRDLCNELDDLLLGNNNDVEDVSIVGRRIKITNGNYKGCTGIVTGQKGTKYWNVKLDNGEKTHKMPHNFEIIQATQQS